MTQRIAIEFTKPSWFSRMARQVVRRSGWIATALGIAALLIMTLGVVRLKAPVETSDIAESAAMTSLIDIGGSLRAESRRVVQPAIERTQKLASSPDVIAALRDGDAKRQTDICNQAITLSTEIDAIALFDAAGKIVAINSVYASGKPIAPTRIDNVMGLGFGNRDIVQKCLRNGARTSALEFQTTCDITPALFDSSGLSVAYSVPVVDPTTSRPLGVVSSRLRFERLSDLVKGRTIGNKQGTVEFVTDDGKFFSEEINAGRAKPPIEPKVLAAIISPLIAGQSNYSFVRHDDKFLGVFRLRDFSTLSGGGIQILVVADDDWVMREARSERFQGAVALMALSVLIALIAALVKYIVSARKLQTETNETVQRLGMVLASNGMGTWDWDLKTDRMVFDERYAALLGVTLADLEQRSSERLRLVHPDDKAMSIKAMDDYLAGLTPIYLNERRVRHADGSWRWLRGVGKIMAYALDGTPSRMVGACTDVTAEKTNADLRSNKIQLQMAKETAEAASFAKSEFLANMSHEIRTPMTAVLGYADMLLEPGQPESVRIDRVQTIRKNSEHLLSILNDILDISKIEAGRLEVETIAANPMKLVADVMSLMRVRALEKRIELNVAYATPIPSAIKTDPTRLRQILINLLGNAIKFTESGGVNLLISLSHKVDGAPMLQFGVIDSGIGMNEIQMEQLFRPFVQADSSMTRRFGGTGLGLSICRRLAQMLGGDISVQSRPGSGSQFTATIGTGDLTGIEFIRENSEIGNVAVSPMLPATSSGVCINGKLLLAEDGLHNQRVVAYYLEKAGATVSIASNGQIACDMVEASIASGTPYDLILMDMQMPVIDGYTAAAILRDRGWTGPIIALTAHAMAHDRAKCIQAGCTDHVSKPIDRELLLSAVQAHLKKPVANGAIGHPNAKLKTREAA